MTERKCFDCGRPLEWVGSGPGYLNADQWEASKAGDYFVKCERAVHSNGNCYFIDTPTVTTLKPKRQ